MIMNFLKQEIAIIKGIELIRAPIGRIQIKENAQQICILLQQSRKPEVWKWASMFYCYVKTRRLPKNAVCKCIYACIEMQMQSF